MSLTAVVTGGTGFIGWNLCEYLRDRGWRVRAVVRPTSSNPLPEGIERVRARLRAHELTDALRGVPVVFHLAGLTRAPSYEQFEEVNVQGAVQVARACRQAGSVLLLVSSQAAAGPGTIGAPRREQDPPSPVSEYGRSKLQGERAIARIEGLRFTIVRPPAVYGPRDHDFLLLFRLARRGWVPVLGPAGAAYTLVYVADAVAAMQKLAQEALGGNDGVLGEAFFLGHPEPVDAPRLRATLEGIVNRRVRPVRVPRSLLWTLTQIGELQGKAGRPGLLNRSRYQELVAPGFVCNVSKLERVAGFRAGTDLQSGFEQTWSWYRDRGLL